MNSTERRQSRRFFLQQPATVSLINNGAHQISALTENVSLGGVFLFAGVPISEGSRVEVNIILRDNEPANPAHLRGAGHVVRVLQHGERYGIAISCNLSRRLSIKLPSKCVDQVKSPQSL
ncbi:MAG TPA: PilZ domain-containing protein [Terriglobales bacterium]|nr:PilZ domain-containing protein [Terriglobales bacterium]